TLRAQWLLDWYGFQTTAFSGFKLGKQAPNKQWLSHPGGHELFLNAEPVANCQAPLLGASRLNLYKDKSLQAQSLLLALCQDELVILTPEGELVEKLSVLNGLPENTSRLQVVGQDVLIRSNEKILSLNIDNLETQASPANVKEWSQPSPLPQELIERISQKAELPGISMETLILDLHSGRFFGNVGVLFVDLIGLLVCVLALTGLWAWYSHHRLKKLGD
ncbi:MAG: PepSY domain-containing protein, partial [Porticoccus sp.]|nr:PepSY domain-containing protein [Porticoccus sp.]